MLRGLLGWRPGDYFDRAKMLSLLNQVVETIRSQPDHVRQVMNNFVVAVGVSYLPLHEEAVKAAEAMGEV